MRSFVCLPDVCRTFYPPAIGIRDTQHGARFLPLRYQVCLTEQAPDIGACVVSGHRSVRVAEERSPIFHRLANGAQATGVGVSQIVDAYAR